MGIIELGLLYYNQQVLTNASREGARAGIALTGKALIDKGIVNTNDFKEEVDSVVQSYCINISGEHRLITFDSLPIVNTEVDAAPSTYPYTHPAELTVTTTHTYTFLVPGLLHLGTSMQLSASTVMNMERTLN